MARKRKTRPGPYLLHVEVLRDRVPDFKRYPFSLPWLRELTTLTFHPRVTFVVGENGTGKSTLLEAVAVGLGLNAEGGSRNFNFSTRASHSELNSCLRLGRAPGFAGDSFFLRAESYFNVATEIERLDRDGGGGPPIIDAYGGVSLHEQSHGESFFALFKKRFRNHGLYVLDEPEAALSPKRQLEFLALLHRYVKGGAQFIFATHSPIIMAYPDARIYQLDGKGLCEVAYEDTEHYLVTRGFLSNPQRTLAVLLEEEEAESGGQ